MTQLRSTSAEPFADESLGQPGVRGFLHRGATTPGDAMVLTHGAGSNSESPLLVALASEAARAGFTVLRCDLAYRQMRRYGPPFPAGAAQDRESLRRAVLALRRIAPGRVFLGGHSYGGRQASMLAAEEPALADGLLLLSYPLHPPRRPAELRTAHFPKLRTRALFAHGSRDPFGSLEEMRSAIALIPAPTALVTIEGAGHELSAGRTPGASSDVAATVLAAFREFAG